VGIRAARALTLLHCTHQVIHCPSFIFISIIFDFEFPSGTAVSNNPLFHIWRFLFYILELRHLTALLHYGTQIGRLGVASLFSMLPVAFLFGRTLHVALLFARTEQKGKMRCAHRKSCMRKVQLVANATDVTLAAGLKMPADQIIDLAPRVIACT
jgi:hypothetical protein